MEERFSKKTSNEQLRKKKGSAPLGNGIVELAGLRLAPEAATGPDPIVHDDAQSVCDAYKAVAVLIAPSMGVPNTPAKGKGGGMRQTRREIC